MKCNLEKTEIILPIKYILSKETKDYLILGFNSILSKDDGVFIDYRSAEWQTSSNHHFVRSELVNLSNDVGYLIFARDYKINQIESFETTDTAGIELLRIQSKLTKNESKVITKADLDKKERLSFEPGDRVWYQNEPGVISYKHKGDEVKYTVNVKDTFTKYVPYWKLSKRVVKDYSHIVVPEEVKKMHTKQILNKRVQGHLSDIYKAELQNREHVKKKKKIKEYGK